MGLFEDRFYVLIFNENIFLEFVKKVEVIVKLFKSKVYFCDFYEYDWVVVWIFYLFVMVSFCLIFVCMSESNFIIVKLVWEFVSFGFYDISWVGGGNFELGWMMVEYNCLEVLRLLIFFCDEIDELI